MSTTAEQYEIVSLQRLELLVKARRALGHALGEVQLAGGRSVRVFVNERSPKDLQASAILDELRAELGEVNGAEAPQRGGEHGN